MAYPRPNIPTDPDDPEGSKLTSKIVKVIIFFFVAGALIGIVFSKMNLLTSLYVSLVSAVFYSFSAFMFYLAFNGIVLRHTRAAGRLMLPRIVDGWRAVAWGTKWLLYGSAALFFGTVVIKALLNI